MLIFSTCSDNTRTPEINYHLTKVMLVGWLAGVFFLAFSSGNMAAGSKGRVEPMMVRMMRLNSS